MNQPIDGGPAFPVPGLGDLPNGNFLYPESGMSLLDHFAGEALKGLMARNWSDFLGPQEELIATWAKSSYRIAGEMLKVKEAYLHG